MELPGTTKTALTPEEVCERLTGPSGERVDMYIKGTGDHPWAPVAEFDPELRLKSGRCPIYRLIVDGYVYFVKVAAQGDEVKHEVKNGEMFPEEVLIRPTLVTDETDGTEYLVHDGIPLRTDPLGRPMCDLFDYILSAGDYIRTGGWEGIKPAALRKITTGFRHRAQEILDALAHNKVVHCDIKPENIRVCRQNDGSYSFTLFDPETTEREGVIKPDTNGMTASYILPSAIQSNGSVNVTHALDVYAMRKTVELLESVIPREKPAPYIPAAPRKRVRSARSSSNRSYSPIDFGTPRSAETELSGSPLAGAGSDFE